MVKRFLPPSIRLSNKLTLECQKFPPFSVFLRPFFCQVKPIEKVIVCFPCNLVSLVILRRWASFCLSQVFSLIWSLCVRNWEYSAFTSAWDHYIYNMLLPGSCNLVCSVLVSCQHVSIIFLFTCRQMLSSWLEEGNSLLFPTICRRRHKISLASV